ENPYSFMRRSAALVLSSRWEALPTVLIEAMACGCAVVATPVGGIPEIMTGPPAGHLMAARDADAMLEGWRRLESSGELDEAGRAARRDYAERFGWAPTTRGQLAIFSHLTGVALDEEAAAAPVGHGL
ncbi:glycosyltransferase, partial [Salinisphaera sp.]|uniref:glycosyltransferase n=1 Tax=Salinisphaera sp. TaxID=1914330 RepID=UPI002D76A746